MSEKPVPTISDLAAPFWQGTAARELRVLRCRRCDHHFLYAHEWCPRCWAPEPQWAATAGLGTVVAATVVHQAPYAAFATDVPYVVAIVRLDEGPRMMANIVTRAPERVHIGLRVEVDFEMRGEIALAQFRPANAVEME